MPLIRFRKENGELVFDNKSDQDLYIKFKSLLHSGVLVDAHFEIVNAGKSLAQLSKIHKMIREIAVFSGEDFDVVKREIKRRSGLSYKNDVQVEMFISFANCSKDEIAMAIHIAEQIGLDLGIAQFI
jgi:hypothetical protein